MPGNSKLDEVLESEYPRAVMDYETVREVVTDGTLVFFKAKTWGQKLISWITNGEFSHCGICTWVIDSLGQKRLMLLESTSGGCRLVNLSSYMGREARLIDINLAWEIIAKSATDKAGVIKYSPFDFVIIGLKDIMLSLGLKKFAECLPNTKGEVCSEFLASLIWESGMGIEDVLVSPQDLYDAILSSGWIHREAWVK